MFLKLCLDEIFRTEFFYIFATEVGIASTLLT